MQRLRPLGHTPVFMVPRVARSCSVSVSLNMDGQPWSCDTGSCDATAATSPQSSVKLNQALLYLQLPTTLCILLSHFLCLFLPSHFLLRTLLPIMDTLVAQYSRPMFQNEGYSHNEEQELAETLPPLSLKFALPPVDKVSLGGY